VPDKVSINQSLSFEPRSIVVVIGTNNTVVWTNNDGVPHTVTAVSVPNGATKFNSGNMDSGTTFTYTFTVPGTYTYDCAYHYWMTGTIVVEQ
jgi:plastocyanin